MSKAVVERKPKRQENKTPALAETWENMEVALPEGYLNASQTLAVSLARAEVDQQIATARALPRDIQKAVNNIRTLATIDEQTAKENIYALPRAGKSIRGPSIRLAEIIFSQWGNARVGSRVVHVDKIEKFVEAEGIYHDLETNAASTARVRRRIVDKEGRVYNDDMILVTGNAACSIAKRNAILGGVPKAVWRNAYELVEKVVAGEQKTLTVRRADAIAGFGQFGVTGDQILAALELKRVEEITVDHMPILQGMFNGLRSGESTVEEMFKAKGPAPARPKAEDFKTDATGKPLPPPLQKSASPPHDAETGEIKLLALDDPEFGVPDAMDYGREARRLNKALLAMPQEWREGKNEPFSDAFKTGWHEIDKELLSKAKTSAP